MAIPENDQEQNKTKQYFYKIAMISYLCGLPNFWIEDLGLPRRFIKIYDTLMRVINTLLYIFILIEMAAFFTQDKLTHKQKSDLLLYGTSHPILYGYRIVISCKETELRDLLMDIIVRFKIVYNDTGVEKQMIKKSLAYSAALIFSCIVSVVMYTSDSLLLVIRTGVTFNVIITAWPDVEDTTMVADAARIVFYIFWLIFMSRVFAAYILVICLSTCVSYQFKQLQSYFYTLNDIFSGNNNHKSQRAKEMSYEKAFKVGVKLHLDTLRCTKLCDSICQVVFSGQIVFNVILIVILLLQMVNSERTLVNTCGTVATASSVLISTGFFMWNAGDVTVEASQLSTAMYCSGWNNCQGSSSSRVRKLVAIAMVSAQKAVVLKGLYIIDLSYSSYLSIVKSSYSVFSVIY